MGDAAVLTGRCYCGARTIRARSQPTSVTYCHCQDCRRISGAPVAVLAACYDADVDILPDAGTEVSVAKGVTRSFCSDCGSPLTGRYDYLPGQVYLHVGLLDQAAELVPVRHGHLNDALPWLSIEDDLPRDGGSARDALKTAAWE